MPRPLPPPVELRSPRLLLRRWQPADRAPFAAINADPRVMEHYPATLRTAESDAFIARIDRSFDEDGLGLWALEHHGRLLGYAGLLWQLPPLPSAPFVEVGWRLAAEAWGQGYATEAAAVAIDDGFARLQLPEILSVTATVNDRSRAVMARLGMRHDPADDFDHPRLPSGHRLERHVLFRLARTDWPGAEQAIARATAGARSSSRAGAGAASPAAT